MTIGQVRPVETQCALKGGPGRTLWTLFAPLQAVGVVAQR